MVFPIKAFNVKKNYYWHTFLGQIVKLMGKFKYTTLEERQVIIKMHQEHKTMRKIGHIIGKSTTAIYKIINAFKKEGRVAPLLRKGRPRITSKRIDTRIVNMSNADPTLSAPKICATLKENSDVVLSAQTVRRRLHESGKHGRVARRISYVRKKKHA